MFVATEKFDQGKIRRGSITNKHSCMEIIQGESLDSPHGTLKKKRVVLWAGTCEIGPDNITPWSQISPQELQDIFFLVIKSISYTREDIM